jgi:class 3 adenylate cyclase/pimeloyl-ACP methyl ester carboxylesterase
MERPIRFSRTHDGFDIAYWAMGEGPALVAMPSLPWSHIEREWSIPAVRSWYEAVGWGRRLVRYDGRGFGLSTRDVPEVSLESDVSDLTAVVDALSLDPFDLYAGLHSGPAAIVYATRHPDRVGRLVLFCSYADGAAHRTNPLIQATRPIILQDWEFYSQVVARLLLGWTEPEAAQAFSELVFQCTSPEFATRALAATSEFDVTGLLKDVAAPTLVLHRPEQRTSSMDNARALATGIPDVRLSLQPGDSIAPYLGETSTIVQEIDAFLTGRQSTEPDPTSDAAVPTPLPPGLGVGSGISTVVFTDVVASTERVERLGDEQARTAVRSLENATTERAAQRTGRVVKHLGDGSLLEFASTSAALRFAGELQASSTEIGLEITIGMAVGEPIREDGDLHGSIVALASRITASAEPGEVLVSDATRQLVQGKGFDFDDLGTRRLKGFDEPMQLWRLNLKT